VTLQADGILALYFSDWLLQNNVLGRSDWGNGLVFPLSFSVKTNSCNADPQS